MLPQASGPRELEDATAELLGDQLHRALHGDDHPLFLEWWGSELVRIAESRCHEVRGSENVAWEGPWLLLHGLTSIAAPGLAAEARRALKRVKAGALAKQRDWLPDEATTAAVALLPEWARWLGERAALPDRHGPMSFGVSRGLHR